MIQNVFTVIVLILSVLLGGILLTTSSRLWRLGTLAGLFLAQFILTLSHQNWLISVTLLILGWMSCAVLGSGNTHSLTEEESLSSSEAAFRWVAYLFFISAAFFLAQKLSGIFTDLDFPTAFLGMILAMTGIIATGFLRPYYNVIFGLLLFLAGFELIYYALETSLLVVGLLGALKMGLSLIGSYWYIQEQEQAQ